MHSSMSEKTFDVKNSGATAKSSLSLWSCYAGSVGSYLQNENVTVRMVTIKICYRAFIAQKKS